MKYHGPKYAITMIADKYDETSTTVIIPAQYNTYNVEYLQEKLFKDNTTITAVTLPNTIKYIGEEAFSGCTNLTTINFAGTQDEWQRINKCKNWNKGISNLAVIFSNNNTIVIKGGEE